MRGSGVEMVNTTCPGICVQARKIFADAGIPLTKDQHCGRCSVHLHPSMVFQGRCCCCGYKCHSNGTYVSRTCNQICTKISSAMFRTSAPFKDPRWCDTCKLVCSEYHACKHGKYGMCKCCGTRLSALKKFPHLAAATSA